MKTNKISMMELRRQLGEICNRVYFYKEEYIVERAGKARAKIVPIKENK